VARKQAARTGRTGHKRPELKKHTGVSAGSYNFQQEHERTKGSVGFNTGPDTGKRGHHLKTYYVTAENWHHKQLSHGQTRGQAGVREGKRITHKAYPHTWKKFTIRENGRTR